MAAVEVLAAGERVGCAVIGVGYGPEDEVDLVHEVGPAEGQMEARTGVEDYAAAFGIGCARVVVRHIRKLRTASDGARNDHGSIAPSRCRVPAPWRAVGSA